jgi:hypothetical protein
MWKCLTKLLEEIMTSGQRFSHVEHGTVQFVYILICLLTARYVKKTAHFKSEPHKIIHICAIYAAANCGPCSVKRLSLCRQPSYVLHRFSLVCHGSIPRSLKSQFQRHLGVRLGCLSCNVSCKFNFSIRVTLIQSLKFFFQD